MNNFCDTSCTRARTIDVSLVVKLSFYNFPELGTFSQLRRLCIVKDLVMDSPSKDPYARKGPCVRDYLE